MGDMRPPPMRPPPPRAPKEPSDAPVITTGADAKEPVNVEPLMRPPPPRAPKDDATAVTDVVKATEPGNGDPDVAAEKPKSDDTVVLQDTRLERPYEIPEWSHAPGKPYKLEVLKEGAIFGELDVSEKGAYMFGRHENCDFVLEHPSSSRHHAVLQYNSNGDAFVYDLGSTHGTFINKRKLKAKVHVPVHVGDMLRFGLSSRMYIFQGPQELLPEEGLLRHDRQMLRQLEAVRSKADEEASLLRARIDAATVNGISWGMGEDAIEEENEDEEELTWETYKGLLTEKQQKTMDQIQKRNEKLTNLKKEIDAIQAKEIAQGGLTQGQQLQVARNQQRIEELLEQLENLEETLNDSIKESVRGRPSSKKKKNRIEEEEDDLSDDDFYDRTKKKQKKEPQQAESADSLLQQNEQLAKEMEAVREKLKAEEEKKHSANEQTQEQDTLDPLDAFMTDVSSKIVEDVATRLKKELERLQGEAERVAWLLKVADPTGEATGRWKAKANQSFQPEVESETAVGITNLDDSEATTNSNTDENLLASSRDGRIWIGAPRPEVPVEPTLKPLEEDGSSEQFVQYKDRKEGLSKDKPAAEPLQNPGNKVERAVNGSNEVENPDSSVVDDIALLLRHKKGLTSSPEAERPEKEKEAPKSRKGKKKKKTLGPELPDFMNSEDAEYESWVPPEGQTGDGWTLLNDKYGY